MLVYDIKGLYTVIVEQGSIYIYVKKIKTVPCLDLFPLIVLLFVTKITL